MPFMKIRCHPQIFSRAELCAAESFVTLGRSGAADPRLVHEARPSHIYDPSPLPRASRSSSQHHNPSILRPRGAPPRTPQTIIMSATQSSAAQERREQPKFDIQPIYQIRPLNSYTDSSGVSSLFAELRARASAVLSAPPTASSEFACARGYADTVDDAQLLTPHSEHPRQPSARW